MISLEIKGKTECIIIEIKSIKKKQIEILELKHKITLKKNHMVGRLKITGERMRGKQDKAGH